MTDDRESLLPAIRPRQELHDPPATLPLTIIELQHVVTIVVRPEHAVEMFRLLPHAQLAVLPGTDHMAIVHRAAWQVSMVEAFLDAPMPAAESQGSKPQKQ